MDLIYIRLPELITRNAFHRSSIISRFTNAFVEDYTKWSNSNANISNADHNT